MCKLSLVLRRKFATELPVCLNYLLSVNDILDLASYNRDKFVLSVTIASKKKEVKTSLFD